MRQSTAEQAAYELAKPAEKVTILVQYNLESKWFLDRFLGGFLKCKFNDNERISKHKRMTFPFIEYNHIKDQPGDSYFVRALFTRQPDYNDLQQLAFTKVGSN